VFIVFIAQVHVGQEGSCAQIGMIAKEAIAKDEVLFEIPRSLLLNPATCAVASLLSESR